ncbi:DUF4167 domain-containing protein [Sphingomonas melonis]|uniref:DUF4167 domain-containing protein n=1 Tax=Sphingomonas melonis TaxID=152682 RepID=A0A7Y9K0S6_9SPHN|nr:DUF4167 domain-containing protein [Sphingomonas melonis]NYD88234.1 hypothetical protein [Sphingomonas melonis]
MINNRQQNGRRRGRGGNNGGNNGPRQGGQGRPDNGNRIDSRARGNANQLFEKYKNLASEAQRQGDRVNTEYYLQFADHYFRVIADQRGRFEDNSQPKRQQPFDLNDDDDYGDEGEPIRAGEQDGGEPQREQQGQARGDQQRDDRGNRDERPQRRDRQDGEQRQSRQWDDRGQRDGNRDDRPQREERAAREDRPQQQREDRPQREDRVRRPRFEAEAPVEVAGQRRADPLAEGENLQDRTEAVLEADSPVLAPRPRRGRPRRDAQVEAAPEAAATPVPAPAPVAEASEGNGVDADRLPPSLNIAAANDAEDEAPKPRRRRVRTPAADVPAAE